MNEMYMFCITPCVVKYKFVKHMLSDGASKRLTATFSVLNVCDMTADSSYLAHTRTHSHCTWLAVIDE